jgi:Domain of unknown function (DU1801).
MRIRNFIRTGNAFFSQPVRGCDGRGICFYRRKQRERREYSWRGLAVIWRLCGAVEELRPLLIRLRAQLAKALPDAEEVIAYKMPGFTIGSDIVAGYAAFSK